MVIDEIERVANDSKRGDTLINYLTQLVNQSNIAICFVGNESANKYFEMKEYMSRRTIGLSIHKMKYDEEFYKFLKILFEYQYTLNKVGLSPEYGRVLYKLTNGVPSMVVSLFVETQKSVILSEKERMDVRAFETTFKDNFSNMIPYLNLNSEDKSPRRKKDISIPNGISVTNENVFSNVAILANKNLSTAISILKEKVYVEFVSV